MFFHPKCPEEEGQSLLEYALILMLVAVVIIALLALLGNGLKRTYCGIVHQVVPDGDISTVCSAPVFMPFLADRGPGFINVEPILTIHLLLLNNSQDDETDTPEREIKREQS